MNLPTKITIIGCGAVTRIFHLPALAKLPSIMIVGLADNNEATARQLAGTNKGILVSGDHRELLDAADLVLVATPHQTHFEIVSDCLQKGKHVLCEKPLATHLNECTALIDLEKSSKGRLFVGLFRRTFPAYRWLKQQLAAQALGSVRSFLFEEGGSYNWPTSSGFFWNKEQAGGGVLADTGAHTIDLLIWWLGGWESVCYWDDNLGNMEAHCRLELTLKTGIKGIVELSRLYKLSNRFRIECEHGWYEAEASPPWSVTMYDQRSGFTMRVDAQAGEFPLPWPDFSWGEAFQEQWSEFIRACQGEPAYLATATDALEFARLLETCYANRHPLVQPWLGLQSMEKR